MLNKRNGITLIALTVTVIVLLILTGISISMVVVKNGIIDKSMDAKEETVYADAKEKLEIEILGSYDESGNVNLDFLNDNLKDNLGGIKFKYEDEEEYQELTEENKIEKLPVTVKYKTAEVDVTGEASFSGKSGKDLIPKEDYGKYVDYGLDINGNNKTTDDWKIFYTDEDGRIFLIAADYVTHTCKALSSAITASGMIGYSDDKNDNDSEDYETYHWKSGSEPEYDCNDGYNTTLNSDKDQCSFPKIFMPDGSFCSGHYYCSDGVENCNSRCASSLQCTENWRSFIDQSLQNSYADYAIGGPTIEMWIASWNELHGDEKELYVNNDEDGYYLGDSAGTYKELKSCEGYNDTLYIPHTTGKFDYDNDNEEEICLGYWIASPAAKFSQQYVIAMNIEGNFSWEWLGSKVCGVRPVICLKPETKLVKNIIEEDKVCYKLQK